MNFEINEDQRLLRESFARMLDEKSCMARVRECLASGFDVDLWRSLAGMGAFSMRVPESAGGLGLGTLDVAILMEEVGRTLATGPIAECILAARLLAVLGKDTTEEYLSDVLDGQRIVSLALHDLAQKPRQWVSGGAVTDLVIARYGEEVRLIQVPARARKTESTLAGNDLCELCLADLPYLLVAKGERAATSFLEAVEEWKLLIAATLAGLSREAIRRAAEYASVRKQFDVLIGTFQAISHPLADLLTDIDGGRLLLWKTLYDINAGEQHAASLVSLVSWWVIEVAGKAVAQALHTFGGYGLTTEYDIHLFNLRAKAIPLVWGDPRKLLHEGACRRYDSATSLLPDVGEVSFHFDLGAEAQALAREVDDFFVANLTAELREKAHYSWDGHDAGVHRKLAEAGLLFPGWPREFGGRGASPYALNAVARVWEKHGWGSHAANTTGLVGLIMHRFAGQRLRDEVLAKVIAGEALCSLGYSEPGSGSDVFAAQCRATRDGDEWVIEGTKMFTSGANISDYVLMLTRTNTEVAKHKGLTMFIVPLRAAGVSVQPVYTFQEERTNITFYDGVRIPDAYRLGDVDGGVRVMAAGLELEHGGGFAKHQFAMLRSAETLCREIVEDGMALIEQLDAQVRLARTWLHAELAEVIANRALWAAENRLPNTGFGPMAKLFSSEKFLSDARDLLDLTAPDSLSRREGPAGFLNQCYRHAQGTTIYGGTSEIHRSQIAERGLGLPRSRT